MKRAAPKRTEPPENPTYPLVPNSNSQVKKPWKNTRGQFCSELIARMFHEAGLPDTDWDFELVSPEDLRLYCEAHPELFEREAPEDLSALAA